MPVKAGRTATEAARQAWNSIKPGDIFFTTGGGGVGALIRRGTESPYGHCGVIAKVTDEMLIVDEAMPSWPPWSSGLNRVERSIDTIAAVVRVWRTEDERIALCDKSDAMVAKKLPYAWTEILIIAAANVLPHSWIPNTDLTTAVICSNHVSQCIQYARPDDYDKFFRYSPNREWPGGTHFDLQRMLWNDRYGA